MRNNVNKSFTPGEIRLGSSDEYGVSEVFSPTFQLPRDVLPDWFARLTSLFSTAFKVSLYKIDGFGYNIFQFSQGRF